MTETASTQLESLKKIAGEMTNMTVNSKYAQVTFLIDFIPTIGQFEYFTWPSDYTLTFAGWNPVVKVDGIFTMAIGLPSIVQEDIKITSYYRAMHVKEIILTSGCKPDWKAIIADLTSSQISDLYD